MKLPEDGNNSCSWSRALWRRVALDVCLKKMFPDLLMSTSSQNGAISGIWLFNGNLWGVYSVNGSWNEIIPFVFTCEPKQLKEAVTVIIITSQTFISGATKISYLVFVHNHQLVYVWSTHHHEWSLYLSESMHSRLTKSVCWVLPKNWIGVERLIGGELPKRPLRNWVSPTSTPKSKKLV